LRGNLKREKITNGDERRIHYEMRENKTNLRAMRSRKISESEYESLRALSHITGIAELKLLWMLVFMCYWDDY